MSDARIGPAAATAGRASGWMPAARISPAAARIAPFALFIAFLAAAPLLSGWVDARWIVVARGLAVAALLALLWRHYVELHRGQAARASAGDVALAVGLGAAVFVAWIGLDAPWATMGQATAGFAPVRADGGIDPWMAGLRLFGLVLAVPVMEELFWRSFLMRWIGRREFLSFDPRGTGLAAFALSSALFALEHSQWFAGLLAGAAYGWLYMRSRNLWIAIVSHATTNALLGFWILATRSWHLW